MSRRTLTILITILFILLAWTFFASDRRLVDILEWIGAAISKLFN